MNLDDADRRLREIAARLSADDRAYLLEVLTAGEGARVQTIGDLHATGLAPATVELLIDPKRIGPSERCWSGCSETANDPPSPMFDRLRR